MTLVCVWRDNSYGIDRLIALADMRISRKENGRRATISDLTRKLIPLSIRCHETHCMELGTGALSDPYARLEAAVAYSGDVIAAQAIIAHVQQDLANLIAICGRPEVHPAAIGVWLAQIVARYFESHADKMEVQVTLIVFGWQGEMPWFQRAAWKEGKVLREEGTFDDATFLVAGEDSKFVQADVDAVRTAITRHKQKLRDRGTGDDSRFDHDLERARHDTAALKSTEQAMLDKILSEANASIGGTLQKLELAPGQRAACTRATGDYDLSNDLSLSLDGVLVPIDLAQRMGR